MGVHKNLRFYLFLFNNMNSTIQRLRLVRLSNVLNINESCNITNVFTVTFDSLLNNTFNLKDKSHLPQGLFFFFG